MSSPNNNNNNKKSFKLFPWRFCFLLLVTETITRTTGRPHPSFRRRFIPLHSDVLQRQQQQQPDNRHTPSNPPTIGTRVADNQWSSLLSVDPRAILSTLIDAGGLLIPDSVEAELQALKHILHADQAGMNVMERHLVLRNFTVGLEGSPPAVRIDELRISWDSYRKPCLEVDVRNMYVLIEFANLILTRNNWNELHEAGLLPESVRENGFHHLTDGSLPFLRFSKLNFSGVLDVSLLSRPLAKEIGGFSIDVWGVEDLQGRIRQVSTENERKKGRKGCTCDDLAEIFKSYFADKVKAHLAETVYNVTVNLQDSRKYADGIVERVSGSALSYLNEAGRKSGKMLEDTIVSTLGRWGLSSPREKFDALKNKARDAFRAREVAEEESKKSRMNNATEW